MKDNKYVMLGLGLIVIVILFFVFTYKNQKIGNTINNKSTDEIVRNVLSISSYKAIAEVTIQSNKTTNHYTVMQEYIHGQGWKQTMIEPEELAGVITSYHDGTITLENTNLGLQKLYESYEDYHYMNQNALWLSTFISGFTGESTITENEEEIIVENRQNHSPYLGNQILHISKKTKLPTEMKIQDNNKNTTIYIKYKEIQLNKK